MGRRYLFNFIFPILFIQIKFVFYLRNLFFFLAFTEFKNFGASFLYFGIVHYWLLAGLEFVFASFGILSTFSFAMEFFLPKFGLFWPKFFDGPKFQNMPFLTKIWSFLTKILKSILIRYISLRFCFPWQK